MSEDVQEVMVETSPVEKPSFDGIFDEDKIIGGGEAWTSTTGTTWNHTSTGNVEIVGARIDFNP